MRELLTMTLSESDRLLAAADAGASLDGGSGGAGLEHDADQIAELEKRQDWASHAVWSTIFLSYLSRHPY